MVSDYEARLEEAYYATAAVKGALKWALQVNAQYIIGHTFLFA
jgi:hypothetical protein